MHTTGVHAQNGASYGRINIQRLSKMSSNLPRTRQELSWSVMAREEAVVISEHALTVTTPARRIKLVGMRSFDP